MIIGGSYGIVFALKLFLDYYVINLTPGDRYDFNNVIIYIIFLLIEALLMAVVLPLMLNNLGNLIKYEYIVLKEFDKLKTEKNPNEETYILVVFNDDESKSDKI